MAATPLTKIHTQLAVTMDIGRSVATSHLSCFNVLICSKGGKRLSGFCKVKVTTFKVFMTGSVWVLVLVVVTSISVFKITLQAWRSR
jgi:hypothetical protein